MRPSVSPMPPGRDRFEPQPPAGQPVVVVPAPPGHAAPRREGGEGGWTISPALAKLLLGNAVLAYLLLAAAVPAPWGPVVPLVVLAQVAIIRRGAAATLTAAAVGFACGGAAAALRVSRGGGAEPLRLAIAGVLLATMALAVWPRPRGPGARA